MREDRYEIRGVIGQGGVGSVYRAFDTQLNREVAIKRVLADADQEDQDEATKSLLQEASALSSLQHPHIVTIYDAGVDEDGPYVIMELIDGRTLDEMVEDNVLVWEDLEEIALQSQEGLIAAQDLDLVHRDLKPSNIMICWLPSGKFQVKIVDFGLAKFSATPSLQTIDHGDSVFGSIFFMAPEQFERTPLDKRTDMYALGCLYYYALTGQHPFSGETPAQVMVSHLQHHVTHLSELRPDIPKWGADWIMWHIQRQMEDRPADARAALERFIYLKKNPSQGVKIASPVTPTLPATPTLVTPGLSTTPTAKVIPTAPVTPTAKVIPANPVIPNAPATPPSATPPAAPATTPISLNPAVNKEQPTPAQPTAIPTAKIPTTTVSPAKQDQPAAPTLKAAAPVATSLQANVPTAAATVPVAKATPTQPGASTDDPETHDASGMGTDSARRTMPAGAKWALICMLIFVIVVAAVVGSAYMGERKKVQLVNDVMLRAEKLDGEQQLASDGIELTQEELLGTLNRATSMGENKQQAILLKTLRHAKASGSFDVDAIILDHTIKTPCPASIRAGIFQDVIKSRQNPDSAPALLAYASNSDQEEAAAAALDAFRWSASGQNAGSQVKDLINLIKATESSKVRMAAERACQAIIDKSTNKADIGATLYDNFKNSDDDNLKFTMLRLLGITGQEYALDAIDDALNSEAITYQTAALAALAKWENDEQFPTLVEFIKDPKNKDLRWDAFKAAYQFLGMERERDSEALQSLWSSLAAVVENKSEKSMIINGMAQQRYDWAIKILEPYTKDGDDKIIDRAELAIERIKKNISKASSEPQPGETGTEE